MIDDAEQIDDEAAGFPLVAETGGRLRKAPSAFRTISEVADELHIPQHVLRFWETRFPQVKPLKRGGGRRYYRPDDIALLRSISNLLYIQGYTIKGVQRLLREGGGALPDDIPPPGEAERSDPADADAGASGYAPAADGGEATRAPLAELAWDPELPGIGGEDPGPGAPAQVTSGAGAPADPMRAALRDALAALEAIRALL